MKINFFGNPFPIPWTTEEVEAALEQLMAGRTIINEIMAGERSRYTEGFRDADILVPQGAADNRGAQVRYQRAILAYRLRSPPPSNPATYTIPQKQRWIRKPYGDNITKQLELDKNPNSDHKTMYHQAAEILKRANDPQGNISWEQLQTVFTALDQFVRDTKSGYQAFEDDYISRPKGSGEPWADQRLISNN